jgi:hypothetical protein
MQATSDLTTKNYALKDAAQSILSRHIFELSLSHSSHLALFFAFLNILSLSAKSP